MLNFIRRFCGRSQTSSVVLDFNGFKIKLCLITKHQLKPKYHSFIHPSGISSDIVIDCRQLSPGTSEACHDLQLNSYLKNYYFHFRGSFADHGIDQQDINLKRIVDPDYYPLYNRFCCQFLHGLNWPDELVILPLSNYCILYYPAEKKGIYSWRNQYQTNFIISENLFYLTLSQYLAKQNGVFFHGSAVLYRNQAYLFLAESGGGKSTILNLCKECQYFSDDGVALINQDNQFKVLPTPFSHFSHSSSSQVTTPHLIQSIFILKKNTFNSIEPVSRMEALPMMLHHLHYYFFMPPSLSRNVFETCYQIISKVPVHYLNFHIRDDSVFEDIYRFLNTVNP